MTTQKTGSPPLDPRGTPQAQSLARTRTAATKEADAVHIVRRGSDKASVLASPGVCANFVGSKISSRGW